MLSARRIQSACPQCRSRVLRFYESGFVDLLPAGRPRQHVRSCVASHALPLARQQRTSARAFSSTRQAFQEPHPSDLPQRLQEEIETTVRQARQTFGNTLPVGYLTEDEYRVYERLYGPPLRETQPEDVGIPFQGGADEASENDLSRNALLRKDEFGNLEEVEYTLEVTEARDGGQALPEGEQASEEEEAIGSLSPTLAETKTDYINVKANNQREYGALLKLQKDFEAARLRPVEDEEETPEEPEEEEEDERDENGEDEDEGEPDALFLPREDRQSRVHELTMDGQFTTSPSTLRLPKQDFVEPIASLLGRSKMTHVRDAAERAFGGPGLPYSPATPESKKNLPQKPIPMEAGHHRMSEINSDAYIATVLPGVYASVMSTLVEVRKRLGTDWIKNLVTGGEGQGPRVLDVGAGGAGLAAWQEVLQAEWDVLKERGEVTGRGPPGKRTVVVGSDNLRHRVSRFLHNTTFLPRLPDYTHSAENAHRLLDAPATPQPRKTYDVIIASHTLMPIDKPYKRRALLDNLWSMLSPDGGVLIVLEKGHPRGFEAVADVRQRLLDEFIVPPVPQPEREIQPEGERVREPGMIIAPCTNHSKCPMYLAPGLSPGRKDFCHFSQRFTRPPFLQRILGASHRNHEDVKFSFVAARRGAHPSTLACPPGPSGPETAPPRFVQGPEAVDRAFAGYGEPAEGDPAGGPRAAVPSAAERPHPLSLPRNILPPLKRRGHVTMDVCTPAGAIERWTVPRSFDKQAYHDARKARWGDLWALGAKTRVRRDIRLGKTAAAADDGGVRARDAQRAGKRARPTVVEMSVDPRRGVVGAQERFPGGRAPAERRTKGGRRVKIADLLEGMEGAEEDEIDEELRELERSSRK